MLKLKLRVQKIFYQTKQDELGIAYANPEKKLSLKVAAGILEERQIDFSSVLRTQIEYVEIELPIKELESIITK